MICIKLRIVASPHFTSHSVLTLRLTPLIIMCFSSLTLCFDIYGISFIWLTSYFMIVLQRFESLSEILPCPSRNWCFTGHYAWPITFSAYVSPSGQHIYLSVMFFSGKYADDSNALSIGSIIYSIISWTTFAVTVFLVLAKWTLSSFHLVWCKTAVTSLSFRSSSSNSRSQFLESHMTVLLLL